MKLNKLLSILVMVWMLSAPVYAEDNIEGFAKCLASFEAKSFGQETNQVKVDRELVEVSTQPSVSSSVGSQADLLGSNSGRMATQWNVAVSKSLYSPALSKSLAGYDESIRASNENEKAKLAVKSLEKLDTLFQYVSAVESRKLIARQIDRQSGLSKLLQELTRARVGDGANMLSSDSDLITLKSKKKEIEVALNFYEKRLQQYPFFNAKRLQDEAERSRFFEFSSDISPLEAINRSEIKALDRKAKADIYFIQSEKAQWYPKLDLSIEYSKFLGAYTAGAADSQLLTGLTLSFPISESYSRTARSSFFRAELSRNEILRERERSNIENESTFEKDSLVDLRRSIDDLSKSLSLLSQARSILVKKFSLNKTSYFELSSLDDRMDQISKNMVSKRIDMWRILSKWYLQRISIRLDSSDPSNCR